MDKQNKGVFYGAIKGFDEDKKTVESVILHYGVANENYWTAMPKSLDAFIARINKAGKGIAACYQHDERTLIGKWLDFRNEGTALIATLHLSDTPFVRDTVIPQLKDNTLQGSSPSIGASEGRDGQGGVFEITVGAVGEISLVGLPADLEANILKVAANIEAKKRDMENFNIELL